MYSGKHLFAEVMKPIDDPDEWTLGYGEFDDQFELRFPNMSHDQIGYGYANWGKLLPWHEAKACNGIVWRHDEAFLTENADKCDYAGFEPINGVKYKYPNTSNYSIPSRGNCRECGANGPLGKLCVNMCAYTMKKDMIRDKEIEEDYPFMKK